MIRSTPVKRDFTDGRFQTGRRLALRSSALRRPTFTLVKPLPTGVVIGPFNAILFLAIESSSGCGSVVPCSLKASAPAENDSHSGVNPAASSTRTTARVTSGPIPSPGINVIVLITRSPDHQITTSPDRKIQVSSFPGFPEAEGETTQGGDRKEDVGQSVQSIE